MRDMMGRAPDRLEAMGATQKTEAELDAFLVSVAPSWTAASYDLWTKNCNNFSEAVVRFLCGRSIPAWILELPNEIRPTPLGRVIAPMMASQQDALKNQLARGGGLIEAAAPPPPPAPEGPTMTVTVKAAAAGGEGPKKLTVSATATVGDLRELLQVDGAPRFVFMGKLLKDDAKTLGSYGVKDGLVILVVGARMSSSPASSPAPAAASSPPAARALDVAAATPLELAIARAEASGGADVLKTLHKILSNVVRHQSGTGAFEGTTPARRRRRNRRKTVRRRRTTRRRPSTSSSS